MCARAARGGGGSAGIFAQRRMAAHNMTVEFKGASAHEIANRPSRS